jgi:hypothetical protein
MAGWAAVGFLVCCSCEELSAAGTPGLIRRYSVGTAFLTTPNHTFTSKKNHNKESVFAGGMLTNNKIIA